MNCAGGGRVVQERDKAADTRIVFPGFEGERSLPGSGQHLAEVQPCADPARETQAIEPRTGQNDRGVLARPELFKARVNISADVRHTKIRPKRQDLRLTSNASGADQGALRKLPYKGDFRCREQSIPGVLALRYYADLQRIREVRGQVFGAVYGEVDFSGDQGLFDFFDKNSPPACRPERHELVSVRGGLDDPHFERRLGKSPLDLVSHPGGLSQRQFASARPNNQHRFESRTRPGGKELTIEKLATNYTNCFDHRGVDTVSDCHEKTPGTASLFFV